MHARTSPPGVMSTPTARMAKTTSGGLSTRLDAQAGLVSAVARICVTSVEIQLTRCLCASRTDLSAQLLCGQTGRLPPHAPFRSINDFRHLTGRLHFQDCIHWTGPGCFESPSSSSLGDAARACRRLPEQQPLQGVSPNWSMLQAQLFRQVACSSQSPRAKMCSSCVALSIRAAPASPCRSCSRFRSSLCPSQSLPTA